MLARLAATLLAAPFTQAVPPTFRVVLLESPPGAVCSPVAINSGGEVAGWISHTGRPWTSAAHWDADGSLKDLGHLGPGGQSSARAINDSGVVAGNAFAPGSEPVLWSVHEGGRRIPCPRTATAFDLNTAGDVLLQPFDSSAGIILGTQGDIISIDYPTGLGAAFSLNDDRRVAGCYLDGAHTIPFRWDAAQGFEVLALPLGASFIQAEAVAIAGDGTVAGYCRGSSQDRAVTWDAAGHCTVLGSSMIVLYASYATDLNANAWVVGSQLGLPVGGFPHMEYRGTVWVDGNPYELERQLEPGLVVKIAHASAVNRAGQILCFGSARGKYQAFRLDPL